VSSARLSLTGLSVRFGSLLALDDFELELEPGSLVALLGANGSGKSTMIKALTGVNPILPGAEIVVRGSRVEPAALTPNESRRRGIRVVHQESPLVPTLTVAEAICLSTGFPTRLGVIDGAQMMADCQRLLDTFEIDVDPRRRCGSLSPSERALVSLAVALSDIRADEAILVLDETTASLSTTEASRFLRKVRQLVDDGLSVIMVTHRLDEVSEFCDEMLVLRAGRLAERFDRESFTELGAVRAMVGPSEDVSKRQRAQRDGAGADTALTLRDVHGTGVRGVSLTVEQGAVLGVTGRLGGGASELLRLIAGVTPIESGEVTVFSRAISPRRPRDSILAGVYYLASDRLTEGGVPALSVRENMILPLVERYGIRQSAAADDVRSMMVRLGVSPADPTVSFGSLSGGNQQKVLLARWLLLNPRVLLLDDPTVGVDPHTREVIFGLLDELVRQGTTVLLRSSEPEQLARLCDRVVILRDGAIVDELTSERNNLEEISLAAYA
jgi:ABC-type sugar transport system ATPase subunit